MTTGLVDTCGTDRLKSAHRIWELRTNSQWPQLQASENSARGKTRKGNTRDKTTNMGVVHKSRIEVSDMQGIRKLCTLLRILERFSLVPDIQNAIGVT